MVKKKSNKKKKQVKTKKEKKVGFFSLFFSFLILALVIFELLYFLKFKPFFYPASVVSDNNQESLINQLLLQRKVQKIPLEEKIGSLFMVGFTGQELTPTQVEFFQKYHFHNFLLLSGNIKSLDQLKTLTKSLNDVKAGPLHPDQLTGENVKAGPLHTMIAVDQEGGRVNRIPLGDIDKISQAEITKPEEAWQIASARADGLWSLGINVNLAPVCEVIRQKNSYLNLDQRAFVGDEGQVFNLCSTMIRAYQEKGILAVAKHFPGGLGRQMTDPHQQLGVVDINLTDLRKDLEPINKLITTGELKAIMTTHLSYPQIDPLAVSLSKRFITEELRQNMNFGGLVFSDDLRMKGITNQYSVSEASKMAILAGSDILIISGDTSDQVKAYDAVLEAVKKGDIPESRIDLSVRRILQSY